MRNDWQEKVKDYCDKYNIPLYFLAETMYEPKVVPMIRGKAFEFSVMIALRKLLPNDKWEVSKEAINAQTGIGDIDVKVKHKPTGKIIRIECKLSKKGGFRHFENGSNEIRVKCMRSRTLGPSKVKELAPKLGVNEKVLAIHNDQYLPADFDVVVTSIGNAFYTTDSKTGLFEWGPTKQGIEFLSDLGGKKSSLKDFAFEQMYLAKTNDLSIGHASGVVCTRTRCKNKKDCGFVPNYPIIRFAPNELNPNNGWVSVNNALSFFENAVAK